MSQKLLITILSIGVVSLALPSLSQAEPPAATKGNAIVYKDYPLESWATGYLNMVREADKGAQADIQKIISEGERLERLAQAADSLWMKKVEERDRIKKEMEAASKALSILEQNAAELERQAKAADELADKGSVLPAWMRPGTAARKAAVANQKSIERLQEQGKKLGSELAKVEGRVKALAAPNEAAAVALAEATPAVAHAKKLLEERRQKAKIDDMSLDALRSRVLADQQLAYARDVGNAMFDKQKQDYYDSKLLLTDFDTLKAKHKMTDLELGGLKLAFEQRLNNTLLGEYVNDQIRKTNEKMLKGMCDAQLACPAASASNIAKEIGLVAPTAGQAPQIANDGKPPTFGRNPGDIPLGRPEPMDSSQVAPAK